MIQITTGWLARHTPQGPGGRQAALIDIAQDLLLTRLHQRGVFHHLVFKGGTALRKLYAGNAGRFSTDLDFSVRTPADALESVAELLRSEIDGRNIDGFSYFIEDHRGRAQVSTKRHWAALATSRPSWTSARHHGCLLLSGAGCVCRSTPPTSCRSAFQ
jgi:uncharacterized protein